MTGQVPCGHSVVHRTQRKDIKFMLEVEDREGRVRGKYLWRIKHMNMEFSKNELDLARA